MSLRLTSAIDAADRARQTADDRVIRAKADSYDDLRFALRLLVEAVRDFKAEQDRVGPAFTPAALSAMIDAEAPGLPQGLDIVPDLEVPAAAPAVDADDDLDPVADALAGSAATAIVPPKRGRGRPRKVVEHPPATVVEEAAPAVPFLAQVELDLQAAIAQAEDVDELPGTPATATVAEGLSTTGHDLVDIFGAPGDDVDPLS